MPEQPLPYIGMQMGFKLRPVAVMAANDQFFPQTFFQFFFEPLGHSFEVVHGFIGCPPLGVPAIITAETVAASAPR